MKQLMWVLLLLAGNFAFAQDANVLVKEGENLERQLKEEQALEKYKQALAVQPDNLQALIRSAELSCGIGARQTDKKAKTSFYENALQYADKAISINENSADANYVRAVVAGKFTEIETENKKVVANVRDIRIYADKALAINPNHARANYVLGKWHWEMVNLAWVKRAAVKVFFGGLPDATMNDAFMYMEKCKKLDPYFMLNFLELAKAYKSESRPAKAIEVLSQLVKLPLRTADDAALKAEGKKMLEEMQ